MDNLSIDPKKLIEQDPEFATYVGKALVAIFTSNKNMLPVIGAMYGFYNMGMTSEQVEQWWRNAQLFGPTDNNQ